MERIAHYEIQSRLGSGGMGEVWKAYDPKLQRTVAIKVLKDQSEDAASRILAEARAASGLSHPNICTVHDVGEADGQSFIVMEYVEGKPLSEVIPADGLPPETVIRYGTQIADALAHAHEKGIIHRDLKSANVVVTPDGRATVLDFGVADRLPDVDAEAVTRTQAAPLTAGTLVGTLAYMAPEVLRGEMATARSDVWSLGVLLYEMAAGRLPFEGGSVTEVTAGVLKDSPGPLPPRTSPGMRTVAQRCLAKEPGQRYGHAAAVHAVLEALQSGSVDAATLTVGSKTSDGSSIAVLPFVNLSHEPDQEYFSDGLTDEVISDLSKVGALTVISRTSAMQLKGTTKNIKEIGQDLKVRYVLEGSVRKAGNSVRVTAQLIDVATDVHLWSDKYTGTLDDIFDIQEKLSRQIVDALELRLSPEEDRRIAERPIQDARAYEYYLKGRKEIELHTGESFNRALRLYREALDLIGENAPLYAGLGYAHWAIVNASLGPDDHIAKAEQCAHKALALNPDSAEAHLVLGLVDQAFRGDQQAAVRRFEAAAAISPNDPHVLFWLIVVYAVVGRADSGLSARRLLQSVDPLTAASRSAAPLSDLLAGRYGAALDFPWCELPDVPWLALLEAMVLTYNKRFDALQALIAERVPDDWEDGFTGLIRLAGYAAEQDVERMTQVLTSDRVTTYRRDPLWAYWVGSLGALGGQHALALDWVTGAVDQGFVNYPLLAQFDPFLTPLHGDPRYQTLVERVKREWEAFEV